MLFTVLVSFSVVSYIREKTDCLVLTFSGDTEIAGDLRDDPNWPQKKRSLRPGTAESHGQRNSLLTTVPSRWERSIYR